jgi:hypothetical protein
MPNTPLTSTSKPGNQTIPFSISDIHLIMVPKSKSTETKENPFLPPPIDLDRVPLAEKDYLIVDMKCEFNFF